MSKFLLIYQPTGVNGLEYATLEGETPLEGIINHVQCGADVKSVLEERDVIQETALQVASEAPTLIQEEIGQVAFYDMFINDQDGPIPVMLLNLGEATDVTPVTLESLHEMWEGRPGAKTYTAEDLEFQETEIPDQIEVEDPISEVSELDEAVADDVLDDDVDLTPPTDDKKPENKRLEGILGKYED